MSGDIFFVFGKGNAEEREGFGLIIELSACLNDKFLYALFWLNINVLYIICRYEVKFFNSKT